MTRAPVHVLPVDARGDHRPFASCPCRPLLAGDLLEGPRGTVYYVHRHAPEVTDAETTKPGPALADWA